MPEGNLLLGLECGEKGSGVAGFLHSREGEMSVEGSLLSCNFFLSQGVLDARLKGHEHFRSFRHACPDHARPFHRGKGAETCKGERKRGLIRDDLGKPRFDSRQRLRRNVAEELERHVQILRSYPSDRGSDAPEAIHFLSQNHPHLLRKEDGDECPDLLTHARCRPASAANRVFLLSSILRDSEDTS